MIMSDNRFPKLIQMFGVAIREFKSSEGGMKIHCCIIMEKMDYDLK